MCSGRRAAACLAQNSQIAAPQWHVEDDFLTEPSRLEAHLARPRPIRTRRTRICVSSFVEPPSSCRTRAQGAKKSGLLRSRRGRIGPGPIPRPFGGGRQSDGKRHSQPFREKRLANPGWVLAQPSRYVVPAISLTFQRLLHGRISTSPFFFKSRKLPS